MIHKLKYKGREEIGEVLGNWYAPDLVKLFIDDPIDAIIPVPLHKKRLRERGYNQVTTFGNALSQRMLVPVDETLLYRTSYSKTQTRKTLLGRIEVNKTLFDVQFTDADHFKHFLLIDDVLTTGSTLEACARALLKIPGAKISVACMAMSHS